MKNHNTNHIKKIARLKMQDMILSLANENITIREIQKIVNHKLKLSGLQVPLSANIKKSKSILYSTDIHAKLVPVTLSIGTIHNIIKKHKYRK